MGGSLSVSAADKWVKTAPADLATGDVVVIVDQTSRCAMSNNKGTSSAPAATEVKLNKDLSEITSEVAETLQWKVTVSNGSYQFGVSNDYLYCTNTNNGVRVGSNENNAFTIYDNDGVDFLVNTATSRYIGVYNSQDWRCYTSINSNIKNCVTAFYKKTVDQNAKPEVATINGISPTKVNMGADGSFTFDITYTDNLTANDVTITWVSDNEDVLANVEGQYLAGDKGKANVTVTVTPNSTDDYEAVSETFEVFVVDPNANDGSAEHPYTVEEAREAIDLGEGVEGVYATGIVSNIATQYDDYYGNISFDFVDNEGDNNSLRAYRCVGDEAANVQVGDVVKVYGNLTKYNNYLYEFGAGCELVSLTHPTSTTPAITVVTAEVNADAEGAEGTLTVTYENITEIESVVYFCDANGGEATYDWIEAEIDNDNNVYYLVGANTGEARTAYLKVYALGDNAEDVYSNLVTITQAAYVAPAEELGTFVKVTSTNDITSGQYLIVYEDGRVAFNGSLGTLDATNNVIEATIENDEIVATTDNIGSTFTIDVENGTLQSASGLYIGVSSNSNGLKQTEDAETYTNSFAIDNDGNAVISAVFDESVMSLRFNSASNQNRFRYYKDAGQKAIQLYKFVGNEEPVYDVTVSAAKWATYIAEANVTFPQGVSAYIVTGTTESTVELKEVLAVAEGTPVVLNAEAGTYNLEVVAAAECDDVANKNRLQVSDETTGNGVYVLANHNNVPGFYKWAGGLLGAGRVYLPAEAGSRSFLGFGNGTSTGIEAVESVETSGSMFDLQGRRVMQPTKGLYIVGGKKVVLK